MDWRQLPPLNALRAFAAFSAEGSMTAAGARLNVTHAAISQQMRQLEAHLGLALLDRSARTPILTEEGRALAAAVIRGFEEMSETVERLTETGEARALNISLTTAFASNWLMPRLAGFRAKHPEIDLMLDPTPTLAKVGAGGADLAIRYGDGNWPEYEVTPVFASGTVVVAAPELVVNNRPKTPADLQDYPWLVELGRNEVTAWMQRNGIKNAHPTGSIELPGNLMLDGARSGQGIAITTRNFVEQEIAAGRLEVLFEEPEPRGYFCVRARGVARPQTLKFIRWIESEVAKMEAG